jgi:Tfp pilus assembly protein PilF
MIRAQDERIGSDAMSTGLCAGLLVAMILIVYVPAYRAGFVWDDDHHFTANPWMTAPGGLAAIWTGHEFYYPLTSTVWWAMRRLFDLNPLAYHLLNVLLHALNGALLWRLLRRLAVPGAWLAAAVWALHPVNVQSVAWATELKNCLSGTFYLMALLAWICSDAGPRRHGWYGAALIAFVAALLSKTSTVTLPFALVCIEFWRRQPLTRFNAARVAPFFALAAAAGLWTLGGHKEMVAGPEWDLTAAERLALAGRCVWFYLGKLILPSDLSFVYPKWNVATAGPAAWLPLAGLIVLTGALAALWRGGKAGAKAAPIALAYFVLSLLPILNFFRMYYARYTFVADHWQYLASMGAVAWGVGSAAWLARRRMEEATVKRFGALAGGALLLTLGGLTARQAQTYRDNETLWLTVIDRNPTASIAYNNLGIEYLDRGDLAMAESTLRVGLTHHPDDPELATILASALIGRQRWNEAEALLRMAELSLPDDAEILNNLGLVAAGRGRADDAVTLFRRALAREPEMVEGYYNLAATLLRAGRNAEAREAVAEGLRRLPGNPILLGLRAATAESRE